MRPTEQSRKPTDRHGPIEEEETTGEEAPQTSRTGDLPEGGQGGKTSAEVLRKLRQAADEDEDSELRGLK